jgi:hypothetical protein
VDVKRSHDYDSQIISVPTDILTGDFPEIPIKEEATPVYSDSEVYSNSELDSDSEDDFGTPLFTSYSAELRQTFPPASAPRSDSEATESELGDDDNDDGSLAFLDDWTCTEVHRSAPKCTEVGRAPIGRAPPRPRRGQSMTVKTAPPASASGSDNDYPFEITDGNTAADVNDGAASSDSEATQSEPSGSDDDDGDGSDSNYYA